MVGWDPEKNLLPMVPFQIIMVEWNLEKDLLSMIPFQIKDLLFILTYGSKVLLYRLNLQQLVTISPACLAHNKKNIPPSIDDKPLTIWYNGASGVYARSTNLAYQHAVNDDAEIIEKVAFFSCRVDDAAKEEKDDNILFC